MRAEMISLRAAQGFGGGGWQSLERYSLKTKVNSTNAGPGTQEPDVIYTILELFIEMNDYLRKQNFRNVKFTLAFQYIYFI
jgi:hypothetical protein